MTETIVRGQASWEEALKKNDYNVFLPELKEIVTLSKEKAQYYTNEDSKLYDELLKDYEWGVSSDFLQETFSQLLVKLKDLLPKIIEK